MTAAGSGARSAANQSRAVSDKLRDLRSELDHGIVPRAGYANYTLRQAARDWLASGPDGRTAKTIKKNENVLEPVLKVIGAAKLRELTAGDVGLRAGSARWAGTRSSCSRPAGHRCNYNGCMSVSLTIRDLPEATRDMLRQRAEARRQSLNSYIVDLLEREAGLPTMSEWADMVETRARLAGSSDAAVEAVRELRDAV